MGRELEGKRALVTASTKGIGLAIVERLRQDGARVVTTARSAPQRAGAALRYASGQQLQVNTIGAVVKPADSILVVVPEGSTLVVEANVLNRDIGFVREGQDVRVKLEAFPFTKYGVVEGKLTILSRDAVQDEKLGLVFPVRVELSKFNVPVGAGRSTLV